MRQPQPNRGGRAIHPRLRPSYLTLDGRSICVDRVDLCLRWVEPGYPALAAGDVKRMNAAATRAERSWDGREPWQRARMVKALTGRNRGLSLLEIRLRDHVAACTAARGACGHFERELAEQIGCSRGSIAHAQRRLVAVGWIAVIPDPKRCRGRQLQLREPETVDDRAPDR